MREDIKKIFKFRDRHAKIIIGKQPEHEVTHRGYLPGGNIMSIRGSLNGRVCNTEPDRYGRWTVTELLCKGMKNICIVNAYRSNGNITGDLTIASQEYRTFLRGGRREPKKVRKHFVTDLKALIDEKHKNDCCVLITMDCNTDVTSIGID